MPYSIETIYLFFLKYKFRFYLSKLKSIISKYYSSSDIDLRCKLQIENDGYVTKFVDNVYKIVFSGDQAIKYGQKYGTLLKEQFLN